MFTPLACRVIASPRPKSLATLRGTACRHSGGCWTVFSLTMGGQETVLHSFTGGSDGAGPVAGLTVFHGTLYGTTAGGGKYNKGTIFALTP